MKRQTTLFELCAQKRRRSDTVDEDSSRQRPENQDCAPKTKLGDSTDASVTVELPPMSTDIGVYLLPSTTVSDNIRYCLLTNPWTPQDDYIFPAVVESGKNRKFQASWLKRFPWLVYSPSKAGGFCKFCAVFAPDSVQNQKLGRLVCVPLNHYKDALEICTVHEQADYHKASMMTGDEFLARLTEPSIDILHRVDSSRKKQIEENRRRIMPVIKTVIFCEHQELPLHRHRDAGQLLPDSPDHNDRVFRAALRFRLDAGEADLAAHLASAPANVTYLSWETQNEIIDICGDMLARQVADKVRSARFFSILVDETTDTATKEQCSLSIRYVKDNAVQEPFLAFCDLQAPISTKQHQSPQPSSLN